MNFPANPTIGQTFESEGLSFIWDGVAWVLVGASGYVNSAPGTVPGASRVTNIITLDQAAYDAIAVPDPATLYVVVA